MYPMIDGYQPVILDKDIAIKSIISVHYFEYSKNYIFEGESHNFWELLYVDKGEIYVMTDKKQYVLKKGELIFHKPNQWHNVIANGKVAPNLVVVGFECESEGMTFFEDKVVSIDDKIKTCLTNIINEAKHAFMSDLSDPLLKELKKRSQAMFGAEQMIEYNLASLLIWMVRGKERYTAIIRTSSTIREYAQEEKVSIILKILEENLHKQLTLKDLCRQTLLSKSSLLKTFKEGTGISVMEYFKQMKIKEAKVMIREGNHNFTQIASILGYSSIHYFSRIFKQETDMTLTEYADSIKLYLDK